VLPVKLLSQNLYSLNTVKVLSDMLAAGRVFAEFCADLGTSYSKKMRVGG
jgi:hypothetical protein